MSQSGERTIPQITEIIIHHDANSNQAHSITRLKSLAVAYDKLHGAKSYAMYTRAEFGYKWISYQFMVATNGDALQVQDIKYKRHASGDGASYVNSPHIAGSGNHAGIHIMMSGYFHPSHNQVPTKAQIDRVAKIIYGLEKKHKTSYRVRGHREVSASYTACPGDKVMIPNRAIIKTIIDRVNAYHEADKLPAWYNSLKAIKPVTLVANKDVYVVHLGDWYHVNKIPAGTKFTFSKTFTSSDGGLYYVTEDCFAKKIPNGMNVKNFVKEEDYKPVDVCAKKIAMQDSLHQEQLQIKDDSYKQLQADAGEALNDEVKDHKKTTKALGISEVNLGNKEIQRAKYQGLYQTSMDDITILKDQVVKLEKKTIERILGIISGILKKISAWVTDKLKRNS